MKRGILVLIAALPLAACAGGYYGGGGGYYAGRPVGYDGFYDDYYGPIYDGYWGDDNAFYYRHGEHDRHFRRGDPGHFRRDPGGDGFHPMHGSFSPGPGMHAPHFGGGGPGGPGGGFHGGHGHGH